MPHFEQMYRALKDRGITVIAVDVVKDPAEKPRVMRNVAFNGITMPIVFDAGPWEKFVEKTGLSVVDANRRIVFDGHDLREIKAALEGLAR